MDMFNGNYSGSTAKAKTPRKAKRSKAITRHQKTNLKNSGTSFSSRRNAKGSPSKQLPGAGSAKTRGAVLDSFDPAEAPRKTPKLQASIEASAPAANVPVERGEMATALSAFLRDAGRVPLLTPQEEIHLAARIKRGDESARDLMIRANLRLVVKIARDYENLGLPLLDLVSEGSIGLMKAVERFDPAKGGKLSTYGSWWIKQQIRRALANQGRTIRLPVHVEARIYRLSLAEARLREILGREATHEELADELKTSTRRIARLREAAIRPSSLDAPVGEEGDTARGELVADEKASDPGEVFARGADQQLVVGLLNKLPEREARILRARFGLNGEEEQTLEELGAKLGLTRERIRQLQNEAFCKLRDMIEKGEGLKLAA